MAFLDTLLRKRRWARRLAAPLVLAVLGAVAALLRRRRRPRRLGADALRSALPALPAALIDAVRGHSSVVLLGADAVLPGCAPALADLLRLAIGHAVQGGGADLAVEEFKQRLALPDISLGEAELLLGDVCAALGRERVWRSTNAVLRKHASARKPASASTLGARQIAAVASVPFTAVVADAWSEDLEAHFPHRVGRNFGGFAAVLSRPRVDSLQRRARPALQLWPGLLRERGVHAGEGPDSLPTSRSSAEQAVSSDGPYPAFLRDLLRSKTALLAGWAALPPKGHLGEALRQARREALARGADQAVPLAYAIAGGECAGASAEFLDEYGLCVLSYDSRALGESGLEEWFRALADACAAE